MKEKITNYIDNLFADAPKTRKAMDLKEEMTQNTIEKYQDLIADGYREEDAFQNVIHSIGDVSELFEELKEVNLLSLSEEDRQKKAVLTAVSVGLYIFAGAVLIICLVINDGYSFPFDFGLAGFALTILLCIPPTCILVYAANMYPSFHKTEENLVELYKETIHAGNREKALRISVSAIIWTATLILYFLISFVSMRWDMTWILFLAGICAQAIFCLVLSLKHGK